MDALELRRREKRLGEVIPVQEQPEPPAFDVQVRQRGLQSLSEAGISLDQPAPPGFEFTPCWRDCLDSLRERYSAICAFGGFRIERVSGARTVEHFKPKSRYPAEAYEWRNYRLVCGLLNGRKREYEDVLDPFTLPPETFFLDLVIGGIYVNPALPEPAALAARATINRLKLDDEECRARRREDFEYYVRGEISEAHLCRYNPFVWSEARRQGLLRPA